MLCFIHLAEPNTRSRVTICDAEYCFILHDKGQFGSNNDSGVLANSGIMELVEENNLDLLSPSAYKYVRIILYLTFLLGMRSFH